MLKVPKERSRFVVIGWIFVLLLGFRPAEGQFKPRLPAGWQVTEESDYTEEDIRFFNGALPNLAHGDFDGDDRRDRAFILIQKEEAKCGLFVLPGSSGQVLKLQEIPLSRGDGKIHAGLSPVKPGKYLTACGRGLWECGPDEAPELDLTRTGIYFFFFDGHSSIFYWNENGRRYSRVSLSD